MARSDLKQVGQQKVVFRKITRRIVPIRVYPSAGKESKKRRNKAFQRDLKASPFLISAGVAIAIGAEGLSGFTVGKLSKNLSFKASQAVKFTNVATIQKAVGRDASSSLKSAAKLAFGRIPLSRQFARITRLGTSISVGGKIIGAGLVGAGINKVIEGTAEQDSGVSGDIISNVLGAGVAILGAKAFKRGLKGGLRGGVFKLGKSKQLEFKL